MKSETVKNKLLKDIDEIEDPAQRVQTLINTTNGLGIAFRRKCVEKASQEVDKITEIRQRAAARGQVARALEQIEKIESN